MRHNLTGLLLLVSVWVLAGCESGQVRKVERFQADQMRSLAQLTQWSMEGRIAVRAPRQSFSASIQWRHEAHDRELINLAGPFGQGKVMIDVGPEQVVVDDGDERVVYHQAAEAVFRQYFLVSLPVDALRYWLIGAADPGFPFVLTQRGFIQEDWVVEYRQQQLVGKRYLPRKIQLKSQQTTIKIVIDQWKIG